MLKRFSILLYLLCLAFAAAAQQPDLGTSQSQQQTGSQHTSDTAVGKTSVYRRGALSDFMRYAQQVVDKEAEEDHMILNEVFVLSQELVEDNDNQLGVKMQFFNCFNKPIRGIDVYLIPYNAQGMEQSDASGLASMKASCAGRINPSARAETVFPNLFWNKDKQIEYLLVAKIVFTFFDNSSSTYNGINEILKHYK